MAKKGQFVVDSSVVAKWFLAEPGSDKAIELRDEFASGRVELAVPSLLFYEVMNALRFSGSFRASDLVVAARSLSKYRFGIWRPLGKLLELSSELSVEQGLTIYDACYVALGKRTSSRVVTEDKELLVKFPADTLALSDFEVSGRG
ncbi:MAG: type II toxin-antitoxin system VapC family toxin [Nitrososphaerota archaeon]|jgi:predicted nucleic acid-binding protein|nr:type II toxin-antitoxin system VapC family toxin [Nitrososphaerota archaeon]MDG6916354.1 type II toxin-antitoxin system VapC family toxin [Nitrososphaerota archaeon]MDG6947509.1 type II toxin-antitoxin system VapC family toxin [Nitrososphaerota archaeon]